MMAACPTEVKTMQMTKESDILSDSNIKVYQIYEIKLDFIIRQLF